MLPGCGLCPSDRRRPYEARDLQHRGRPGRFCKLARAVEPTVLVQVRSDEFHHSPRYMVAKLVRSCRAIGAKSNDSVDFPITGIVLRINQLGLGFSQSLRLWCVFELAAYRKMNPAGTITIAPLYLENFACQIFLCLHAISIVLSFGRVFYDLGPVFVLSLLGGASVCSFPLAYSLRQHSLERQSLLSGLDTFEVREAWPASQSMFSIIRLYV